MAFGFWCVTAKRKYPLWGKISHPLTISPFLPIFFDGEQILATKEKVKDGNHQFHITEEYLLEFIGLNQQLSDKLHNLRGY